MKLAQYQAKELYNWIGIIPFEKRDPAHSPYENIVLVGRHSCGLRASSFPFETSASNDRQQICGDASYQGVLLQSWLNSIIIS